MDIHGNPLQREVFKTSQTVKLARMSRIYPDHPSRGLTIRKLPRILQAAERGDLSAQACLFGIWSNVTAISLPKWKSARMRY